MKSRRRFWFRLSGVAAPIVLLLLILFVPALNQKVRETLSGFVRTALSSLSSVRSVSAIIVRPLSAISENDALHRELESVSLDRAELERLRVENGSLKKILNLDENLHLLSISGNVIGEFAEGRDEYWVLDVGSGSGISEGDAVVSPSGILIGIIRTISKTTSTLRLISSPSESFAIHLMPSNIDAIAQGDNNGEYVVTLVPADAQINLGDVVLTAGRTGWIPAGLLVGMVVDVQHNEASPFQNVRLKSSAPLGGLDRVFIMRRN